MKKNKLLITIIIVSFIVLVVAIIFLIKELSKKEFVESEKNYSYSKEILKNIKDDELLEQLEKKPHSKTIERLLKDNEFNSKYIEEYYQIKYYDKFNFSNNINCLLYLGYSTDDINYILENHYDYIAQLLEIEKIDTNFLKTKNFRIENLNRYLNYGKENDIEVSKIVTYVNIGLDYPFYENINTVENPHELNVLVNKYNKLPDDFEPKKIVSVLGGQMSEVVAQPLSNMVKDIKSAGYSICFYSTYRSIARQKVNYSGYVKKYGVKGADTISARSGHSEHNLGLAVDFCTTSGVKVKETDSVYKWLTDNAHKYGFIERYPKDKSHITGYVYEPWHYRYLGIDLATKVKESNLTYDEYYDLYIE